MCRKVSCRFRVFEMSWILCAHLQVHACWSRNLLYLLFSGTASYSVCCHHEVVMIIVLHSMLFQLVLTPLQEVQHKDVPELCIFWSDPLGKSILCFCVEASGLSVCVRCSFLGARGILFASHPHYDIRSLRSYQTADIGGRSKANAFEIRVHTSKIACHSSWQMSFL